MTDINHRESSSASKKNKSDDEAMLNQSTNTYSAIDVRLKSQKILEENLNHSSNTEEELPSLFAEETIVLNPMDRESYKEEPASDYDLGELFELLENEEKTLKKQIETLKNSIQEFEVNRTNELEQIDRDMFQLESHAEQVNLISDAHLRNTSQTQIMGEIAILRQNKRQYNESMLNEIRNMELSLAEKEKELSRLQTEIRMLKS